MVLQAYRSATSASAQDTALTTQSLPSYFREVVDAPERRIAALALLRHPIMNPRSLLLAGVLGLSVAVAAGAQTAGTGKTAEEMLSISRARLGNSVETELSIAAEEQNKITEIRLKKLLER